MDPRISVGENYVYITLRDSSRESFHLSSLDAPDKYLYPDTPSEEYGGPGYVHPVFHLGDEKYYFDVPVIGKVNIIKQSKSEVIHIGSEIAPYTIEHFVYNIADDTITLEYEDGAKVTYKSTLFPVEYLRPEEFIKFNSDGSPIFQLGTTWYRFGTLGDQTPVIFHLTYLNPFGEFQVDDAEDLVPVQYAEYLPRKHPEVYAAFHTVLKRDSTYNANKLEDAISERAARYGFVPTPQADNRVGHYRRMLEYLYHTGVLATSSDLIYDLTQSDLLCYPTMDPYENRPNYATTRSGFSKWIACRLACRSVSKIAAEKLVPTGTIVKVQTDANGYPVFGHDSNWAEKRDDWPLKGLRSGSRDDELYEWFNSRLFAYYIMGRVSYNEGSVSVIPASPCGKPEFKEYKQLFEFMPVKEVDLSIRKTADWCEKYNYNVQDHEGVGLYPKINTLQSQGKVFSNFDCTEGYSVTEAVGQTRVFPLLQFDAEHTEPVDLMYEYNKRYYRLNMYDRRIYMTRNPTAVSQDPADIRGDYWLYSAYNVEYQENSESYFPQKARVARDPVLTYPLAADDTLALSYDAIQQDKSKVKFPYIWIEIAGSVLAGVLTTMAVQYAGHDIKVSVISGGVVLFTGLLITLILNLGDIIRATAGGTIQLAAEGVGLA